MPRLKRPARSATPSPRTVFLAEGKTSVRLAPVMWGALEDIARHKGITRQDLLWEIYRDRQGIGFTEAIKVYIVEFYRARVEL
jgi:predicted DNA-binding ribbon-helix-helix protein